MSWTGGWSRREIIREIERLALVQEQIVEIERDRDSAPTPCAATERKRDLLLRLNGIGEVSKRGQDTLMRVAAQFEMDDCFFWRPLIEKEPEIQAKEFGQKGIHLKGKAAADSRCLLAQLDMNSSRRTAHPFFWAAFTLVGEGRSGMVVSTLQRSGRTARAE